MSRPDEPAQPQPRGEKARVADPTPCDRCGNPIGIVWFADNSLFNEITGTVGVGMLCPTCFDHLAAPRLLTWKAAPVGEQELAAPPRGEGDDLDELATLLEAWADEPPSERKDWFLVAGHLREAASALRASTHPEQSARIVGAALDLLDSLGAPHYHDLIGMTYTLRKEQADNLRAALEPASPTPTEQEDD